ncbi:hypothetical protein M2451_001489 [Dysgonomonas sp. PFB1-18]|uniref:hypothetical protein n=1 Tax=unclassified Dysgonomonas TaxID=2630389 RepID=UPI0024734484|nr:MULTISPECIES: hypothetical protein [unclassified Dysgonomonas]MDH6309053.1 hypothetical protein [Dysgonomonas sp. PF1-14]MDH6338804.1 hypothetical protein [Dysgonomonas sp. PF1-16]MDH6380168.1 hypothetical protein [Dysgonomonas sp. PFB1-18]MDH6397498.1 hypothetical protein [Dysgonomonas sp. PF1-23]
MKNLMNLKLFSILSKQDESNNFLTKLEEAYDEFALKLLDKLQIETNIAKLYYHLGFVRLELVGVRDILSNGQEKKCLKIYNQGNLSY